MFPQHGAFSFNKSPFKLEGCSRDSRRLRCSDTRQGYWDSMAWLLPWNGCLLGSWKLHDRPGNSTEPCPDPAPSLKVFHMCLQRLQSASAHVFAALTWATRQPVAAEQMGTQFSHDVPGSPLNHDTQVDPHLRTHCQLIISLPSLNHQANWRQPRDKVWCPWFHF